MVAVHSRSQASRGCSGTWLWTNSVTTSGSRPIGEQDDGRVQGPAPELVGVDLEGERVEVDDAEVGLVLVLGGHPVPERRPGSCRGGSRRRAGRPRRPWPWPIVWAGSTARCTVAAQRFGRVVGVGVAVSTPVFDGPIDLLLHLVTGHELDILDVPLAPVVDAFVAVLHEGEVAHSMDDALRVPPGRGHPGGAQVPAAAARPRRRRPRGRAPRLGRARPAPLPPPRVPGLRGGRRHLRQDDRGGRPLGAPAGRPRGRLRRPCPRPAGRGHAGATGPRPSSRATAERPTLQLDL